MTLKTNAQFVLTAAILIIIIQSVAFAQLITISGSVRDTNGVPFQSASVYMLNANTSEWYWSQTDTDGNYSIDVESGSYYASSRVTYELQTFYDIVWTDRYKYYNNKSSLADADLILANENINNINFTFPVLQIGTISGTVRDAVTLQPLNNVFISVTNFEQGDSTFIGTDQNGEFLIEVFEGEYYLFAFESGYYLQYYKNAYNIFDATPVNVNADSLNISGIDFELTTMDPGNNNILGHIRDVETVQPIPQVQVYAIPLSGENWIEAKSGLNGDYAVRNIKSDQYFLLFYKEGYLSQFYEDAFIWEEADTLNLIGNQNLMLPDIFLKKENLFGGEISGKISSNTGSALSSTLISAINSSGDIISSTLSGFDGNYLIPALINGDYTVKASKIGYSTSAYPQQVQIDLINNPAVDGINISIITTDVREDVKVVPETFNLLQNYPNPFNSNTIIGYQLPVMGYVTLKIYDILGNEVATLVNEEKPAGNYKVDFNGANLSTGIYFYTLRAGKYVQTKKLVLMK